MVFQLCELVTRSRPVPLLSVLMGRLDMLSQTFNHLRIVLLYSIPGATRIAIYRSHY